MKTIDLILFTVLAAIWGSSFIFMRALAPILGPLTTACARTLIAGVFLLAAFSAIRLRMEFRRNLRHYLIIGLLNAGIPFALYSYAALKLPASIPAIVNALTPLWGAVFSALLLKDPLTLKKTGGLSLGIIGVALIALRGTGIGSLPDPLAVGACVLATVCYGIAGAYLKRWATSIPARQMTAASLFFAGLALLPFSALTFPSEIAIPISVWATATFFALLCSAFAYLIYFRLIASAGVTIALSVTLLVPVFAFLWGFLFLGEPVAPMAAVGAAFVLSGTAIVIRSSSR